MTKSARRIAFIGTGNMNEAVMAGALAGGFDADDVVATSRREERGAQLREKYGVATMTSNPDAVVSAETVVLGVKPYQLDDVLEEIGPHLVDGAVVVSLAVGDRPSRSRSTCPTAPRSSASCRTLPRWSGRACTR